MGAVINCQIELVCNQQSIHKLSVDYHLRPKCGEEFIPISTGGKKFPTIRCIRFSAFL